MNTLLFPRSSPARSLVALPLVAVFVTAVSLDSLPAQEATASDGFDIIANERSEMEDLRQFLDLYLKLGNTPEAVRYARMILAKDRRDPAALSALLGIHLQQKNAKSALAYARRYREVSPGGEADALLASALRMNGAPQEALAIMLMRYAKVPKGGHFPQLLELCYCYYDSGKIDEAKACFVKVRDDKRFSARERAEAAKELAAIQRAADIREAYLAIEQRDLKRARRIANDLAGREQKPNREVIALLAVLDADEYGRVDEAVAVFEELKASHKGPEPFPYQSTYAVLLLDQGRYLEAEAAAAEAADVDAPFLTANDARGHLETLRLIRRYSRSLLFVHGRYQSQEEGKAYRGKIEASMPLKNKKTRVGIEYGFTELDFDDQPLGADETDYHSVFATISHQFSPTLNGKAAVGAVAGELAYRVAVRMSRATKEDYLELAFASGQRPTDSMRLEAFGAEERRVTVKGRVEVPSQRRIRLSGEAFVREIDLDKAGVGNLGSGWGARWEAEYLFYRFQRKMLSAAYVGAFEQFDFSNGVQALSSLVAARSAMGLVEDDLHQHGLVLRALAPLGADVMAHAEVGAYYRFDEGELTYSAAVGIEWWINEFMRLDFGAAYYTSGRASNAGSGYFEGQVGVSSTF